METPQRSGSVRFMLLTPEQRLRVETNRLQALERKRLHEVARPCVGKRQRTHLSLTPGDVFQSDPGMGHECTASRELDGFLEAGVIAMQDDVSRQAVPQHHQSVSVDAPLGQTDVMTPCAVTARQALLQVAKSFEIRLVPRCTTESQAQLPLTPRQALVQAAA